MQNITYKVYIKVDNQNRITAVNSSAFLTNLGWWTLIDEGIGDRYHHAQGHYFDKPICTMDGIPQYKLLDGTPTERTAAEIEGDRSIDLPALKMERIVTTRSALADYLEAHPLLWTDGKRYSVTAEKQALLNNALAVHQLGVQAGAAPELTWNATTEECAVWDFGDLCALALGIAAYVKPLVAHQQALEVSIRQATTAEGVQAIVIDYAAAT